MAHASKLHASGINSRGQAGGCKRGMVARAESAKTRASLQQSNWAVPLMADCPAYQAKLPDHSDWMCACACSAQSPCCHGQVTCFSIYCGPDHHFGPEPSPAVNRSMLWVDTYLEGDEARQVGSGADV